MTNPSHQWLPAQLLLSGDEQQDLATLYAVFTRDFVQSSPALGGFPIICNHTPVPGKAFGQTFWHIVSREDQKTGQRRFDPARARRLPWCAAVIANAARQDVTVFDYRKGGSLVRTYLWLHQYDYLVVLQRRNQIKGPAFLLITAYHFDGPWMRKQAQNWYSKRER